RHHDRSVGLTDGRTSATATPDRWSDEGVTEGTTVAQVSALSTLRRALDRVAGRSDGGDLWRAVRDPRTIQRVGSRPDYRFSLANERTFLAWIRTALAFSAAGLAVAAFLTDVSGGWRTTIAGPPGVMV